MTSDKLHLGCGTDYKIGWHNVDVNETVEVDQRIDLNQQTWDVPSNTFRKILASHVFEHLDSIEHALRECHRVLVPEGSLVVHMPIGENLHADPDHQHEWRWQTPEYYCGSRHWDVDTGFEVTNRGVNLWSTLGGYRGKLHRWSLKARLETVGAGRWCFSEPYTGGEFLVRFQA